MQGGLFYEWLQPAQDQFFRRRFRLSRNLFDLILVKLEGLAAREHPSVGRKPLPMKLCFGIYLFVLGQACPYHVASDIFGVSVASVGNGKDPWLGCQT